MMSRTTLTTLLATLALSTATLADPIVIETKADGSDIDHSLGGYTTTPYEITGACDADNDNCPTSFTTSSLNTIHLDSEVSIISPDWVNDPDPNATIFGVHGNIITLTPDKPLGAISFVISSYWNNAGAWVSATSDGVAGVSSLRNPGSGYFPLHQGSLRGIGVQVYATPGNCLTSVTIEPPKWGFGSIRTADCATSVPEPGSLSLLGIGLLGMGFAARRRLRKA